MSLIFKSKIKMKDQTTTEVIDFNSMVGKSANLYYCNELNRFQLGTVIFEAIEDENDGYRSMLQEVIVVKDNAKTRKGDFLASVKIKQVTDPYDFEGWELVDEEDGHIWLKLGTNNADDYYPYFTFDFTPKKQ